MVESWLCDERGEYFGIFNHWRRLVESAGLLVIPINLKWLVSCRPFFLIIHITHQITKKQDKTRDKN